MNDNKDSLTSDYIKGGQVTKNAVVMFWQNVKMVAFPLFVITAIICVAVFYNVTDPYERYLFGKYINAEVHLDSVGDRTTLEFKYPDGTIGKAYASDILKSSQVANSYNRLKWIINSLSLVGLLLMCLLFYLISKVLYKKGAEISKEEVIDGVRPVDDINVLIEDINHKNRIINSVPKYYLCGVPFYDGGEILHMGISGSPGQGKTQILIPFVESIYANGDKGIIYDKARSFVRFFYQNDDVILNPLDERSPPWNIHAEASNATDYDAIFEAMIPIPPNTEPYWTVAARTVASKTALRFRQAGEYRMSPLLEKLYNTTLDEIATLLEGTEAGALIDKDNPKTGESIRSIMSSYIKCLGYCYDAPVYDVSTGSQDLKRLFSLTEWVRDDNKKGCVFITSKGDQNATLKPLITTFFNIAVTAGMSMEACHERRVFVMLDELPALNKLPAIVSGAAELRQFGFSFIGGWQLYSQLVEVYGTAGAQSMAGLLTTRVQFNAGSEETNVKHASKQFATYTVKIPDDSLSIGVGPYRDGANFKFKNEKRDCVTEGQISALPKLHGYIRMAGGEFPVAPFTHKFYIPEPKAEGMVERPLEKLAMGCHLVIGDDIRPLPVPEDPPSEDKVGSAKKTEDSDSKAVNTRKARKLGAQAQSESGVSVPDQLLDDDGLYDPNKAEQAHKKQAKSNDFDIDLFN
ncbi:type IV secretion system DNA-binding domain-containing protein [Vibrio mediterranei]|uniref:Type IV secretion system coupling protein TraD DNA-binding domain-containing protein n=1 Tax=Vibrio mediterranei TaxID=689 RepID=A0ABX5D836_9VIBR|nr:type IV secretion system DNA-binding domain-containing protein [Vibrio mediterranei]PRQ65117.1 hypothetical protein COR51_23640 [Vibrio mediterranei]